jgi:hypothetical protein
VSPPFIKHGKQGAAKPRSLTSRKSSPSASPSSARSTIASLRTSNASRSRRSGYAATGCRRARPSERATRYARGFKGRSTELNALLQDVLGMLVRNCIERHINPAQVALLREAEESERAIIEAFEQGST